MSKVYKLVYNTYFRGVTLEALNSSSVWQDQGQKGQHLGDVHRVHLGSTIVQ